MSKIRVFSLILLRIAILAVFIESGYASESDIESDINEAEISTSSRTISSPQTLEASESEQEKAFWVDTFKNSCQKMVLGGAGLVGTGVTFTLEVLGATGAFWGATDVFNCRDETNNEYFRIAAITIGGIALIRYVSVHALNSNKYKDYVTKVEHGNIFQKIFMAFENPISAMRDSVTTLLSPAVHKVWPKALSLSHSKSDTSQGDIELEEYGENAILLKCTGEDLSGCNNACIDPKPLDEADGRVYGCELKSLSAQNIGKEREQ